MENIAEFDYKKYFKENGKIYGISRNDMLEVLDMKKFKTLRAACKWQEKVEYKAGATCNMLVSLEQFIYYSEKNPSEIDRMEYSDREYIEDLNTYDFGDFSVCILKRRDEDCEDFERVADFNFFDKNKNYIGKVLAFSDYEDLRRDLELGVNPNKVWDDNVNHVVDIEEGSEWRKFWRHCEYKYTNEYRQFDIEKCLAENPSVYGIENPGYDWSSLHKFATVDAADMWRIYFTNGSYIFTTEEGASVYRGLHREYLFNLPDEDEDILGEKYGKSLDEFSKTEVFKKAFNKRKITYYGFNETGILNEHVETEMWDNNTGHYYPALKENAKKEFTVEYYKVDKNNQSLDVFLTYEEEEEEEEETDSDIQEENKQ